ncbi:MAG: hypothetical protein QME66_01725 [Candidatus Eisenbacteria bacterium]|nr:hypothetical protein [Candidatus Eisenbacteria bacterium]
MRKLLVLALPCLILLAASTASSLPTVKITLLNTDIQVFRISDFDLSDATNNPLIFEVKITNDNLRRDVQLSLVVTSTRRGELGSGTSTVSSLKPDTIIVLTNRDLGTSTDFKIEDFSIRDAAEGLKGAILSTGSLPADTYTFRLQLRDVGTGEEFEGALTITVRNPNTLELLGPGTRFGGEPPSVSSPPPPFQWTSQANEFNFVLVELMQDQVSAEEALDNQPQYKVDRYKSPFQGSHFLTYPSSAEALLEGHTYCWQVEAIVKTSGAEETILSEIFWFKIGQRRIAPVSNASAVIMSILSLLPPNLLADVLNQLEGYVPDGNIFLDDKQITPEKLRTIINEIKQGKPEDVEVSVR